MNIQSYIAEPDKTPITITATMTLAEWVRLEGAIAQNEYHYVTENFSRAIRDAISDVRLKIFKRTGESEASENVA